MPIEVRELVIKAVVNSVEKPISQQKKRDTASKKNVTDSIERAIELIKNRNER